MAIGVDTTSCPVLLGSRTYRDIVNNDSILYLAYHLQLFGENKRLHCRSRLQNVVRLSHAFAAPQEAEDHHYGCDD